MDEIIAQFTTAFVPVAGTIITALMSWGTIELTKYVKSKTKNAEALNAVEQICAAAKLTVGKINQKVIPALKEKAADGKLTLGDMDYVKGLAMAEIKQQIPEAINAAAHLSVTSVTKLIENQIEVAVVEGKEKAV